MADQSLVTCFTDLKDSTRLTQGLGQSKYFPYLEDHFSVTKTLTELAGGEYVKNSGDGNMVLFASGERAISFASQLQEFYAEQPCLRKPPLKFGIGLSFGQVERTETDAHGPGPNHASRVQSKSEAGQIIIDKSIIESLKSQWGVEKGEKYVISIGNHELKGISDPPTQELFSFEWQKFRRDNPDSSLVSLIYKHLRQADVEVSNLGVNDLSNAGIIIWPVVPRDLATAIHRGQAEIVRLLALLGWSVKLLIADCGTPPYPKAYSDAFFKSLKRYTEGRDICNIDMLYMSELYEPSYKGYDQIQDIFRKIVQDISLEDLLAINNKKYEPEQQAKNQHSSTLNFLRPALSVAAVLFLADKTDQKYIVVAGSDERDQWARTIRVPGKRPQLGFLMIPILKGAVYQGKHKSDWPIWDSLQALVLGMESTNLAWWTFRLHAYLPAFPATSVTIDKQQISPQAWVDDKDIPSGLQRESLAQHVWRYLSPTL